LSFSAHTSHELLVNFVVDLAIPIEATELPFERSEIVCGSWRTSFTAGRRRRRFKYAPRRQRRGWRQPARERNYAQANDDYNAEAKEQQDQEDYDFHLDSPSCRDAG
jgi:hypothetical protein